MTDRHNPYSLGDWLNYLSHNEIDFLARLAGSLPDNPTTVNIGAGGGTSALTFLTARHDARVITVELEAGITPIGGLENERLILEASEIVYVDRYVPIAGDSKMVGRDWNDPIDMVFIDGDHSYAGCAGDIQAWLPHLKAGGVIAIHDYKKVEAWALTHPDIHVTPELITHEIKPYPGVDKAVDELLLNRYPLIDTVDTLIAFLK